MVKQLFKYCIPTMTAYLFSGLYNIVDGIFIGNALGEEGLAAINIVWPIPALVTALGVGIGTGGSIWLSFYRGQEDEARAKEAYNITWSLLLMAGILLMGLLFGYEGVLRFLGAKGRVYQLGKEYANVILLGSLFQVIGTGLVPILRNLGLTLEAMVSMLVGMVSNVSINYILMFQVKLGIKGAAMATVISQAIAVGISIAVLIRRAKKTISFRWNRKIAGQILKSAAAPMGISLAPTIALVFTNWKCLEYGGDPMVACYAAISYISFPVQNLLVGAAEGAQPLISFYHGAKKPKELKQIKSMVLTAIGIVGVVATIGSVSLSKELAMIFGISKAAYPLFEQGLRYTAYSFAFVGCTKYYIVVLNATMKTGQAILFTLAESAVLTPGSLQILAKIFGKTGIWITTIVVNGWMFFIFYLTHRIGKTEKEMQKRTIA